MTVDSQTLTRSYLYDVEGRRTRATGRMNRYQVYGYDELGRLRNEYWYDAAGVLQNTVTYGYDALNRLTSADDDSSNYAYLYDSLDRPVSETVANPGTPAVVCRSGDFRREHECTTIGAGATCRTCGKHREKYLDL